MRLARCEGCGRAEPCCAWCGQCAYCSGRRSLLNNRLCARCAGDPVPPEYPDWWSNGMLEANYGELLGLRGELWGSSLKSAVEHVSNNRWGGPLQKLAEEMQEAQQDYLFSADGLPYLLEIHDDHAEELIDAWAKGSQIETCEYLGIDIWQYIADDVDFSMEEIYNSLEYASDDIEVAEALQLVDREQRGIWGLLALAAWQAGRNALATQYEKMGIATWIQPPKWTTEFNLYGIQAEEVIGLCDYCLHPLTLDFLNVTEEEDLSICEACGQEFRLRDSILLLLHATGRLLEAPEVFLGQKHRWVLWPSEYQ